MKTKLFINLEKSGITNNRVTELVAKHNEGFNLFLIKEICAVVKGMKSEYPTALKNLKIEFIEEDDNMNVYEDGANINYSIQEHELYELVDEEEENNSILLNPVYTLNS